MNEYCGDCGHHLSMHTTRFGGPRPCVEGLAHRHGPEPCGCPAFISIAAVLAEPLTP